MTGAAERPDRTVAPIEEADLPAVLALLRTLYGELGEERSSVEGLDRGLLERLWRSRRTEIFKARDEGGTILGVLTLTSTQAAYAGGSYGVIDEMVVRPEHRSQGVGELLLAHASRLGRERGWQRLDVTAPTEGHERTRRFYEANGFRFTGPKLKLEL